MATDQELVKLQETLYASKNPTRSWLHCIRRDWIIDALQRHSSPVNREAGTALEVGPGSGIYLPVLAGLFKKVYGSDIKDAYLKHARSLLRVVDNLSLVVDDITDSNLPED